jgi:hypothetical protein
MALRVQAVRKCGVKISENPENLILHIDDMDTLLSSLPEKVPYKVWKKVDTFIVRFSDLYLLWRFRR